MNGGKAFFDTNVLLYMYGGADANKQARAKELFYRYARSSRMLAEYASSSGVLCSRLAKIMYAAS